MNEKLNILGANPIYEDVKDAPFFIGCKVEICWGESDGTFDEEINGMCGVIEYYEYECGCGQTYPNNPMIGVSIPKYDTLEFWPEELKEIK